MFSKHWSCMPSLALSMAMKATERPGIEPTSLDSCTMAFLPLDPVVPTRHEKMKSSFYPTISKIRSYILLPDQISPASSSAVGSLLDPLACYWSQLCSVPSPVWQLLLQSDLQNCHTIACAVTTWYSCPSKSFQNLFKVGLPSSQASLTHKELLLQPGTYY